MKHIILVPLLLIYAACYPVKPAVDQANIQEDTVLALAQELYTVTLNIVACHTGKSIDELVTSFKTNTQVQAIILQAQENRISAYQLVTKAHQLAQDAKGDNALCTSVLLSIRKKDWHYWVDGIKPYVIYGAAGATTLFVIGLCARSHVALGTSESRVVPNHTVPVHDTTQNVQKTPASTSQNTVILQPSLPEQRITSEQAPGGQQATQVQQDHTAVAITQTSVVVVPADARVEPVVITINPIELAPADVPAEIGISVNHPEPIINSQPSVATPVSLETPTAQYSLQPNALEDSDSDGENGNLDTWIAKQIAQREARQEARERAAEKIYQEEQQKKRQAYFAEQEKKKLVMQEQIDRPLIKIHCNEECCSVCLTETLKECLEAGGTAYNLDCCAKPGVVARFICQTCFQSWEKQFEEMMRVFVAGTKPLTMADFRCPCCYKTPFDKHISPITSDMVQET